MKQKNSASAPYHHEASTSCDVISVLGIDVSLKSDGVEFFYAQAIIRPGQIAACGKVGTFSSAEDCPTEIADAIRDNSTLKICCSPIEMEVSLAMLFPLDDIRNLVNVRRMLRYASSVSASYKSVLPHCDIRPFVKRIFDYHDLRVDLTDSTPRGISVLLRDSFPVLAAQLICENPKRACPDKQSLTLPPSGFWEFVFLHRKRWEQLYTKLKLNEGLISYKTWHRRKVFVPAQAERVYVAGLLADEPDTSLGTLNWEMLDTVAFKRSDPVTLRATVTKNEIPGGERNETVDSGETLTVYLYPLTPVNPKDLSGFHEVSEEFMGMVCAGCGNGEAEKAQFCVVPISLLDLYKNCASSFACSCRHIPLCRYCGNVAVSLMSLTERQLSQYKYDTDRTWNYLKRKWVNKGKVQFWDPTESFTKLHDDLLSAVTLFLPDKYTGEEPDMSGLFHTWKPPNTRMKRRSGNTGMDGAYVSRVFAECRMLPVSPPKKKVPSVESDLNSLCLSNRSSSDGQKNDFDAVAFLNSRPEPKVENVENFWRDVYCEFFAANCVRKFDLSSCLASFRNHIYCMNDKVDVLF